MADISGQIGFLFFLIGFVILLLFILIKRVSTLANKIDAVHKAINALEAKFAPEKMASSLGAGSVVPNAVIAAISAAINQYRLDNR